MDGRDGTRHRRPHREASPQALRRLDDLRVRPTRHDEREREGETGIVRVGVRRYCCINAFSVETSARQDLLACLGTSGLVLRLLYYSICCSVPRAFDSVFSTCQVPGGDRRGMRVCVVRDCECPVLVPVFAGVVAAPGCARRSSTAGRLVLPGCRERGFALSFGPRHVCERTEEMQTATFQPSPRKCEKGETSG